VARVAFFDEREWTNWHLTVRDVPIAGRFELQNSAGGPTLARMAESAAVVQGLVARAFAERRRLRAQGSAWSFSEAAAVPGGWCLATGYANWLFPLPRTHVHPSFSGDSDGLFLCQTGISVAELNMTIERRFGRSLATSGASNGQTFVGAMSTGTHGSAIDQPAIQGQIAGLQLIPTPDANLWVEPASNPATDGRMAAEMGATLIRDDRLFAGALVGLGAFGIIHSVLVRTQPIFLLEMHRMRVPFDDGIKQAMQDVSFAGANLPDPATRPYFFQSVVNDHIDLGFAYITVGYKRAWKPSHALVYDEQNKRGAGYNLGVILANLVEAFPGLIPPLTKRILADQLSPIDGKAESWGQTFNFTTPRAGTVGASVAIPRNRVLDGLQVLSDARRKVGKSPLAFACRYVAASPGLLAFTRYAPSVVLDIDGIDTRMTRAVMAEAVSGLRRAGIPHAEHWGKFNQMTAASIRDSYGPDLEAWMKARADLLDRQGEYVFGSAFLDRLGLTNPTF
jgi:FAD/FMN-containing dehydrogenase